MPAFENLRDGLVRTTYENGYTVSVAFHSGAYSDNGETTAEVAIFGPDGEFYRLPHDTDDVIGNLSPEGVLAVHLFVARLPVSTEED